MHYARLAFTIAILTGTLLLRPVVASAMTVGSGKLASETRAVSGFHGVELTASGKLEISFGEKEGLVIEADDNILPLIESKVRADGVLEIGFKSNESVSVTKSPTFTLSAKTLDALTLTGSGSIHVAGRMNADHAALHLPGSGNITVDDLQATAVEMSLDGSGKIKLTGKVTSESLMLDGSGGYQAEALQSDTATVSIDGSGACKVWAEKMLDANISGSGVILYKGSPEVKKRVSGSGTVRAM